MAKQGTTSRRDELIGQIARMSQLFSSPHMDRVSAVVTDWIDYDVEPVELLTEIREDVLECLEAFDADPSSACTCKAWLVGAAIELELYDELASAADEDDAT